MLQDAAVPPPPWPGDSARATTARTASTPGRRGSARCAGGGRRSGAAGSDGCTPGVSKRVSPHRFRHATAVSLVTAEVDVTVIRSWLGHASLDTTNIYARANVEAKRKALEKVDGAARSSKPPRWKREVELMAWLDSL